MTVQRDTAPSGAGPADWRPKMSRARSPLTGAQLWRRNVNNVLKLASVVRLSSGPMHGRRKNAAVAAPRPEVRCGAYHQRQLRAPGAQMISDGQKSAHRVHATFTCRSDRPVKRPGCRRAACRPGRSPCPDNFRYWAPFHIQGAIAVPTCLITSSEAPHAGAVGDGTTAQNRLGNVVAEDCLQSDVHDAECTQGTLQELGQSRSLFTRSPDPDAIGRPRDVRATQEWRYASVCGEQVC